MYGVRLRAHLSSRRCHVYCYAFPFLDEAALGMSFVGQRHVTPLYQHLLHAARPGLGFIGIPLSVPCPIPFFECQVCSGPT